MTAILEPGDEVLVVTPCFVAYQADVTLAGGVPVEVPARVENGFQVTVEALEAAVDPTDQGRSNWIPEQSDRRGGNP